MTIQPFSDPISGGGILVQPEIRSPNFVHLVSGWRIAADGTAEFHSIVVPPGSGGATIFVQGTTPTANNAGDLWYNSASGFEASQWNGSAWVPFQYGTSAIGSGAITAALIAANTITAAQIAAGTITATQIAANTITAAKIAANTITASQLAAGIIYAGIVNGTTITGAQIVADGSSGEILVYSGSPASGNLIAAISGAAGSDSHGNAFIEGIASIGASGSFIYLVGNEIEIGASSADANPANMSGGGGFLDVNCGLTTSVGDNAMGLVLQSKDNTIGGTNAQACFAGVANPVPVTSTLLEVQGNISCGGTTLASMAEYGADTSGYPQATDAAGLQLWVSGSKQAAANTANITTTANTSIGFMSVPQGDVTAGASYSGHASGAFSTGASVPSSATFRVYWGGITGTVIGSLATPSVPASASGQPWYMDFEANWISTTEVEVTLRVGWHSGTGVVNSLQFFTVSDTTGLVTSSGSKNLSMAFQWGSAPGSQQLLCDVSRVGRIA